MKKSTEQLNQYLLKSKYYGGAEILHSFRGGLSSARYTPDRESLCKEREDPGSEDREDYPHY